MKLHPEGEIRDLQPFDDPAAAVARINEIYDEGRALLKEHFDRFVGGERSGPKVDACYPYLRLEVPSVPAGGARGPLSYGAVAEPGVYGTTLTEPALFCSYYEEADPASNREPRRPGPGRHLESADSLHLRARGTDRRS